MSHAILVVDDEDTLVKNIRTFLGRHGYESEAAGSAEEALEKLRTFRPDVVLLDFHLPGIDGLEGLRRIKEAHPEVQVIMITGHSSVRVAVDAMKAGAFDYVVKPLVLGELRILLERCVGQARMEQALHYYTRRQAAGSALDEMVGESGPMLALKETVARLLDAEARMREGPPPAALVTGETGSGKELVARALHFGGTRAAKPFVELNCASIPPNLLESELFGHERGAFTDARERRTGLAEAAHGGTLFLDEIGDTDLAVQAKLLKLIEEKKVRRLGSVRDVEVDVRIVAATHQPLEERIREGKFRADLYYRLRGVQLRVPPLRERGSDIALLARHFLARAAARYGRRGLTLAADAEAVLARHDWPGNVRELRNVIEESALLARGERIEAQHLGFIVRPATRAAEAPDAGASQRFPDAGVDLEQVERRLVEQALERTGWNVTRAARLLNITRDTLRYRIEKFGLAPPAA